MYTCRFTVKKNTIIVLLVVSAVKFLLVPVKKRLKHSLYSNCVVRFAKDSLREFKMAESRNLIKENLLFLTINGKIFSIYFSSSSFKAVALILRNVRRLYRQMSKIGRDTLGSLKLEAVRQKLDLQ